MSPTEESKHLWHTTIFPMGTHTITFSGFVEVNPVASTKEISNHLQISYELPRKIFKRTLRSGIHIKFTSIGMKMIIMVHSEQHC